MVNLSNLFITFFFTKKATDLALQFTFKCCSIDIIVLIFFSLNYYQINYFYIRIYIYGSIICRYLYFDLEQDLIFLLTVNDIFTKKSCWILNVYWLIFKSSELVIGFELAVGKCEYSQTYNFFFTCVSALYWSDE